MNADLRKQAHAVNLFFREYIRDRDGGTQRTLAQYQALEPGNDEIIAEEYRRLHEGDSSVSGAEEALVSPLQGFVAGARIGPYRVVRELGRGGQGTVLLAEDTRLGRQVALKVLTGLTLLSPEHLERFHREAALAARLDHPGLCSVYESNATGGVPYVAMRYVEGETLAAKIRSARNEGSLLPVEDVLAWIESAAEALEVAHQVGIVHRDVKPANLMITPDGEAVVLDFGLAREFDVDSTKLTRTGELFGTPSYMAPEQLDPTLGETDGRTDVWALGVTLFEALTLKAPFRAPTREALYRAIITAHLEDSAMRASRLPNALRVVLRTALTADRERRYATASGFARDLAAVAGGRPIAARPIGPVTRCVLWGRREPLMASLVTGAIALLLTAAGLGGYLVASQKTLDAGETALTEAHHDSLLTRAMSGKLTERNELTMHGILAAEPTLDYLRVGLANQALYDTNYEGALRVLDAAPPESPEPAAFERLREAVLRGLGRDEEADTILASLGDPHGPLESFVAATQARARVASRALDAALLQDEALNFALRAIMLSEHPHEALFHELLLTALGAREEELVEIASDALLRNWPESALSWFYIGVARRGDMEGSRLAYERSIELDPDFAQPHTSLGVIAAVTGDRERGEQLYMRSIELTPNGIARVKLHLAWAATMNYVKDPAAGVEACDRALSIDPVNVAALVRKGSYLRQLEWHDEADEALFGALELDPANAEAKKLLEID